MNINHLNYVIDRYPSATIVLSTLTTTAVGKIISLSGAKVFNVMLINPRAPFIALGSLSAFAGLTIHLILYKGFRCNEYFCAASSGMITLLTSYCLSGAFAIGPGGVVCTIIGVSSAIFLLYRR